LRLIRETGCSARVRSSYARISTYKMSDTDYSETVLFIAFDDGSGKAPTYNLTGSTETKPVTRQGSHIAFQLPFGEPSAVFEDDKFTATLEGQFVGFANLQELASTLARSMANYPAARWVRCRARARER
jgi:hypothetical protein